MNALEKLLEQLSQEPATEQVAVLKTTMLNFYAITTSGGWIDSADIENFLRSAMDHPPAIEPEKQDPPVDAHCYCL